MKIIEHRSHSRCDTEVAHLIQPGVDLARKVGSTMDSFDYVITSPKERAYETAIAMGYAVNEVVKDLGPYNDNVKSEFTTEAHTFPKKQSLLKQKSFTKQIAQHQANLYLDLSSKIKDGQKLLLISHGGVVDIPLGFLFPNVDPNSWGPLFNYCEGFRIQIEDKKIVNFKLLRTN